MNDIPATGVPEKPSTFAGKYGVVAGELPGKFSEQFLLMQKKLGGRVHLGNQWKLDCESARLRCRPRWKK